LGKTVQTDVRAGVGVAAMLDMRVEDDDGGEQNERERVAAVGRKNG
jgi:hypothetical protein